MSATRQNGERTRDAIVAAIRTIQSTTGRAATIRDIAERSGLHSTGAVAYQLGRLRAQGIVEPSDGRAGVLLREEHTA